MSSTTDNEQRFAYLLSPEFQIVNTAGKPLTGGWIEVYIHGTRVKYYCFSDFDGTLHPFQIPLDSLGSNIVLASPTHAYDIYIYNKFGALVMSRYNVVPACNAADIVEDVVVIDSPDETINVTCDGGSNWHLEVNTDLIATASGLAEVSGALTEVSGALLNKKDKQEPIDVSGSVTKTITNIKQNENGEIEITYEDIDLPQQVPNVNIISPSGTLDITSTTDPTTNTKTFKIDVHKSNMDYFEGYYGRAHYEDRPSDTTAAFTTYVDQWREYRYQGDFIANSWQDENNTNFLLNSGLYLITASIRYKMTDASVKNKEEYIRIATGAFNGLENGTQLKDWSNEAALDENTIQLSFVRSVDDDEDYDYLRGNHTLYFAPYLPYGVNYAEIDHLQIVKLDSIVTYHGGPGPMYKPGYGIEIQDDVISVATGTVVTNNYFNTVVSSINNEINEINTTIQNVTGDITELSETITNIVGVTGDFATNEDLQIVSGAIPESQEVEFQELDVDSLATIEYVDNRIASAAGDVYEAGQYVSIENNVINVTGVQPAGDYATNEDLQIVSGAIPESEAVEFEELDLAQFAQASAVTVIQNQINNVTGDINNINEAVTNIIGATGDYATEEYVDEAIAAVTGGQFVQQQSDWTQSDDTKVDYIKHKPREVNLVAGNNIAIEQQDLDVIISATGIPSLEGYATEQYVDEAVSGLENYEAGQYVSIQNHVINVTGVQPEGDYATKQYVDEAVSGHQFEQVNSDWLATSGVAEILNRPDVFQLIAGDNIDITPSGNDLVISASSDVTKAYVDEQIAAVSAAVPEAQVNADWNATSGKAEILNKPQEEEVEFEEVNLSDYALASAIPDVSNFVTQQDIDNSIAPVQSQIDTLAAATGDYLQSSDLDGYATEQYVDAAVDTVTGMIPDVSNFVTQQYVDDSIAPVQSQIDTLAAATGDYLTEQVNADWNATSGVSEILNKPESEEVQFEEVNLEDYALASAIPSLDGYATEQYVDEQIAAVTGIIPSDVVTEQELNDAIDAATGLIPQDTVTHVELANAIDSATALIPDVSNLATNADLQTVSGAVDAVSGAIPESEDVEFEELDLSIYALASAVPDTTQLETDVANLVAATGDYATEQELADAIDAATGLIPDVTTLATKNELVSAIDILQDEIDNIPSGSAYTAGAGIDITNDIISVDDTVLTTAASSVELPNANFGITHDGQAYKSIVSNVKQQVGYLSGDMFLSTVEGGAGYYPAGTYEIHVPVESGQLYLIYPDGTYSVYPVYDGIATWTLTSDLTIGANDRCYFELSQGWDKVYLTESNSGLYLTNQHLNVNYALSTDVTQLETAVTNLAAATGDYATEEYVDEAVAAVTGGSFTQVNSDWEATSGVAEILNKPEVLDITVGNVIAGDNISITASGDDIVISATGGGGSQVQANWTEDDSSDPSYIQNKPTEKNLVAGTNVTITETNDEVTIETTEIASGLQLVAKDGITTEVSGNNLVIHPDETVLFETSDMWGSLNVTLSESFKNFERIAVLPTRYYHSDSSASQRGGVGPLIYFDTADLYHSSADWMAICVYFFEVQWLKTSIYSASNDYKTLTWYKAISKDLTSTSAGTITTTNTDAAVGIKKVIGINRIAS